MVEASGQASKIINQIIEVQNLIKFLQIWELQREMVVIEGLDMIVWQTKLELTQFSA